ncbi:MAG TPA: flavin reductase family protein [Bacteroidota bacterium]|nr:flavin reductase family protein [Bacteroidota bacterium]
MIIDPKNTLTTEMYYFMTASIVPRPIALVTSTSGKGIVNAAPFSYFNAICTSPPTIMIAVGRRNGEMKDTARNILERREFVINIVNEELAEQMNITSGTYPPDVSEVELAGLSLTPSVKVSVQRIAKSPIQFECVLSQAIEVGNDPTDLILGEIVLMHIQDHVMKEGRIQPELLQAIGRLSGSYYCRTTDLFQMKRPR